MQVEVICHRVETLKIHTPGLPNDSGDTNPPEFGFVATTIVKRTSILGLTRRSSRFSRVGSFHADPENDANALLYSRRASTLKSTPYFWRAFPKNYY